MSWKWKWPAYRLIRALPVMGYKIPRRLTPKGIKQVGKVLPVATMSEIEHSRRNSNVFSANHDESLACLERKQSMLEENTDLITTIKDQNIPPSTEFILDDKNLSRLLLNDSKSSQNVKEEVRNLSEHIKTKSRHIRHVEATYTENDPKTIIFLVFAERDIEEDLIQKLPIKTIVRIINRYSKESRTLLFDEENNPLEDKTSREIAEIIGKHSKNLMRKHKYLSYISASSVISKQFGTKNHEIHKMHCITLNVLVKGYIPLDEDPFPKQLDGIPTDVREGAVQFCGNRSNINNNVRMGCEITSSNCPGQSGTLGGFVEHPEYGICAITCAHVVLTDSQILALKSRSTMKADDLEKENIDRKIYQPDAENLIGKLVEVTYKEGETDRPGVDLAVFKIEKRAPTNGEFHDNLSAKTTQPFNTGLPWGKTGIPSDNKTVQKCGSVTGFTKGTIQFDNMVVRDMPFDSDMSIYEKNILLTNTLNKQYHIKSSSEAFCDLGDSGALVFMEDKSGEETILRCIGMVVGVMNDNSGAVTPITAILHEMKVSQLKSFIANSMLDQICKKLDAHFTELEVRFNELENRLLKITETGKDQQLKVTGEADPKT